MPVLSTEDARCLLDSIDVSNSVGLRDRALIGLMVFSFGLTGGDSVDLRYVRRPFTREPDFGRRALPIELAALLAQSEEPA
jgi:hypothetical protein